MLRRRRNAEMHGKPMNPSFLPKAKEEIAVCFHIERELSPEKYIAEDEEHANLIFEDQFSEIQIIESNDGINRLYLACSQCYPSSLEDFYLQQYRDFYTQKMSPKKYHKKVLSWIKTKKLVHSHLRNILRTHDFGKRPEIGNLIHICGHAKQGNAVFVIDTDDEEVDLTVIANKGTIKQPDFLVICPDCVADFDPEELYEEILIRRWKPKDNKWLETCHVLYQGASEFFEFLYDLLEEEEVEVEDYEYDGPAAGEHVLLCDHLKAKKLIERASIEFIRDDRKPQKISKRKEPVRFIAACDQCTEETESPLHAAKIRCKKKRTYRWKEQDQLKLSVAEIGSSFVSSEGLAVEPLVKLLCDVFDKPEWFFETSSVAWDTAQKWAPKFLGTQIAVTDKISDDQRRQGHLSGELWIQSREKHPTTKEESIVRENKAVFFEEYNYSLVTLIPFPVYGKKEEELAAIEAEALQAEEHLDMVANAAGGVKFQIVTLPQRGWREFHYLFTNKYDAEKMESGLDEDEFDTEIVNLDDLETE